MSLFGSADSGIVRVKDVITEAGLTERYFYENFADLDTLFDAVLENTMDTVERDVDAAVADASGDAFARISAALRTAVDTLAADPRMIRIIFVEALGKGGRAGTRRNEILTRAAANFLRWSGSAVGDVASSPVDARMKAFAVSGAASELLIAWAEGLLEITPADLSDFLIGLYWRINLP